jgi:hypothetical protein
MPWVIPPESDPLIGTEWLRREPVEPDDGWNQVKLTGVFDLGPLGLELVISPLEFGPPESCSVDAFADSYTRADNPVAVDSAKAILDRLSRLGAQG